MTSQAHFDRLIPLARQLLVVPIDDRRRDTWLWEHSERVMRLAGTLAQLPEAAGTVDAIALAAAALFHDAGWVLELQQGRYERWQLLTRPTSDMQRELAAAVLQEEAAHILPAPTARLAGEAIRNCNNRHAALLEARILADAEALDEVGTLLVLRQFRQYQAGGYALRQLVDTWQRQKEYRYWEARLADGFHFETTRKLAQRRLESVGAFIAALASDLEGADLAHAAGVVVEPRTA